ncbi:MAG: DUF1492 domain-containing protein [Oscillospiraceae bacterium]
MQEERLQNYQALQRELQHVQSLRETLLARYEELSEAQAAELLAVENAIETLDDPTSRTLLRCYYIEGMTWDEVRYYMHYSRRQIFYLRTKALEQLKR